MVHDQIKEVFVTEGSDDPGKWDGVTIDEVRESWKEYQASQRGDAVYGYLHMVFEQVKWWLKSPMKREVALRDIRKENLQPRLPADLYATVMLATADPQKVDAKQRSKWARALRYVAEYKPPNEFLRDFIQRKGGINESVARYTRLLGRKSARGRRQGQLSHRAKQKRDLRP